MKYTILINQIGVSNAGLIEKTDMIDWAILDYIAQWQVNRKSIKMDDKVWVNYKHLISEMPLLKLNAKQSVSDRIVKLKKLGLIETEQSEDKRIFVKTTDLYSEAAHFDTELKAVRKNVKVSVPTDDVSVPTDDVSVPTDDPIRHNGHSTNNHLTNYQIQQSDSLKESAPKKAKLVLPEFIDKATWDEWTRVRKKLGAVESEIATTRLLNTLAKIEADEFLRSNGTTPNEAIAIAIENSWKGLNIEWLHNRLKQQGGANATHQQYNKPAKLSGNEQFRAKAAEKWGNGASEPIEGECNPVQHVARLG